MFPFSGLFANISCPLALRGRCERPHCFFKHAAGSREEFDASTVGSAGVQGIHLYASSGAPVDIETQDDSFHELERINKAIETVRQEVEVERRRLSGCQIVQENSKAGQFFIKDDTKVDRGTLNVSKTQANATKYVVDNSKPKTDLEYDPLSNFSADLWCHSSSAEGQKVKNLADLKPATSTTAYHPKKTVTWDVHDDDDDDDDRVLIIDVPVLTKESDPAQTPACLLSGGSSHDEVEQIKEASTVPTLLDAPSQPLGKSEMFTLTPLSSKIDATKNPDREGGGKINRDPFCINAGRAGENTVEAPQRVRQMRTLKKATGTGEGKFSQSSNLSAKSVHDFTLKSTGCELPNIAEIKHALQPLTASLSLKTSATNSPHRRQNKEVQPQAQPAQDGVHSHTSERSAQLLVLDGKKMSSEVPRQMQGHATLTCTSSVIHQVDTEAASCSSFPSQQVCATSSNVVLTDEVKSSSELTDQPLAKTEGEVIIISSEDEELNYSDMEVSDGDTMEECYKIFMEANGGEIPSENDMRPEDEAKPAINMTPQPLAGKKRVAHEPTNEPVAKCRPQPQVLFPFRGPAASGFGSQPSFASKIQQREQRSPVQAASVNCGQTSASSTRKKPETHNTTPALTTTLNMAPPHNAYLNHIPIAGAVIRMGNNLRLLVPEGVLPASVLKPIGLAPTSAFRGSQMCNPAVAIVQRGCSGAPVLIPAPAQKPPLSSGCGSAPAGPSQSFPSTAKSVPGKRKLKQAHEAKDKVPHDVRQRYVNMFTEEFVKTIPNVDEAFKKALAEEKLVYNRSVNQVKYQSVAVNALKKLRHQKACPNDNKEVKSGRLKGNIPLNLKRLKSNDDVDLYKCLKDYILTDDGLIENNFPILNPEKSGCAVLLSGSKRVNADPFKRICCRCGATYSVNRAGKHVRQEECTYHYGKGVTKRVPGGVETRYSCCEGVMGAPGCQVFKLHVHDFLSLDGFLSTAPSCPSDTSCTGVFSLDCEMCYTVHGLELSRVTVVNSNLQVFYDTFVKPTSEVIDYNTRFSGVSEEDVKGNGTSFKEVQETLLSFISADTILIGHGLQMALCLLKLVHSTIVDTSEVFPHRLGPPNKLSLNKLTADHLRKIIQESVCGHDTAEDAEACMELMLWKAKEDGKLKK